MLILQATKLGHSTEATCLMSPRLWRLLGVGGQKAGTVLFAGRRKGAGCVE